MQVLEATTAGGRREDQETLAIALETALAPETRARAIEAAAQVRTDGAMVAARYLLVS